LLVVLVLGVVGVWPEPAGASQNAGPAIIGHVIDAQQTPITAAEVSLVAGDCLLQTVETQEDGSFTLVVGDDVPVDGTVLLLRIERAHFERPSEN
jgi:hypothetical protein